MELKVDQRPTFTLAESANLIWVSRSSVRCRPGPGAFSSAYKHLGESGRSHFLVCLKLGSAVCQGPP